MTLYFHLLPLCCADWVTHVRQGCDLYCPKLISSIWQEKTFFVFSHLQGLKFNLGSFALPNKTAKPPVELLKDFSFFSLSTSGAWSCSKKTFLSWKTNPFFLPDNFETSSFTLKLPNLATMDHWGAAHGSFRATEWWALSIPSSIACEIANFSLNAFSTKAATLGKFSSILWILSQLDLPSWSLTWLPAS